MNDIKISVVIPSYNSEKTIGKAIKSILQQDVKLSEIIVVDDGSTDKTFEIAKKFRGVRILRKENGGESSALNVGIKNSKGDFIAIVEADAIIPKNWASSLMSEFKDNNVWGVGGILETANPNSLIAKLTGYEHEWRYMKQKGKYVNHITSTNLIYRRNVFKKFGFFDETLINSCLDADINNKIISDGKKLVLRKDVTVKHFWHSNIISYVKRQWAYAYYRPRLKNSNLYSTDRLMMLEVSLTCLLILSMPFLLISVYPFFILLIILILLQLPTTIEISLYKRDVSFLLYPALAFIRNIVSLIAYAKGKIDMMIK